ncbi:MAG: zinc-dependent peptidase [Rhodocyclaceae bacterium]|nr:zinc-dependent peptidase [Rhodocyclaceae bacterium]
MFSFLQRWRHPSAQATPEISPERWLRLEERLPALDFLMPEELEKLRGLALAFLAEKEFTGGPDFQVTDDMRLTIALTACLPILNLGLDWYGDWVGIIVYPGDFVVPRRTFDAAGVLHEYDDVLAGQAWQGGPVVLSWLEEETPGVNVMLHEFAHKLDMREGEEANGLPPLHPDMSRHAWTAAFRHAFEDFRRRVRHAEFRGLETELDPYGAESPGEFFAVMSEAFFETPLLLREHYPDVYEQFRLFYRQDPAPREAALSLESAADPTQNTL